MTLAHPVRTPRFAARFFRILAVACSAAMISSGSPDASADDNSWVGADLVNTGAFTLSGNWQGNTLPTWSFNNRLVFLENQNSANAILNYDFGDWRDASAIVFAPSFPAARTLQQTGGGGINFRLQLENQSSFTQTITMNLSGGNDGANGIQLNPVNGSLILGGTLANDASNDYTVYGSTSGTSTTLTLDTALGVGGTAANVDFTVASGRNSTVQVNASQAWGGVTTVQSGGFTTAGGVTLASSALVIAGGTFTTTSADTLADSATLTVNGGRVTLGGNETVAALSGSGGTLNLAAASTLAVGGDHSSTTYAGAITGAGVLAKVGAGTLTLSGSRSSTGGTNIEAGTLALGSASGLGSSGTVSFDGGTLRYSSANTTDYSARFSTAAGQAYSIDTDGQSVTYGSGLSSAGGTLTKLGAGTLTLIGNNTYTGTTTIAAGTLRIGNGGTTGSLGGGGIVTNGELVFSRSDAMTVGANVSGAGAVTKLGIGTTTLTGSNSYTGGTTIAQGTLSLGSADAIGSTGSVVFAGGKLQYTAANTADYSSRFIAGLGIGNYAIDTNGQNVTFASRLTSGGVDKFGAGILTLTGSNTYIAPTRVFGGTLRFNGNSSGVVDTVDVLAGATLGGTGRIGGAVTVAFGGTLAPGEGIESLATGALTFTGGSFSYEVDSAAPLPAAGDVVVVTGGLSLAPSTTLTFTDLAVTPAAFAAGTVLTLVNYTGSWNNGLFTYGGVPLVDGGTFTAGLTQWTIDYDAVTAGANFTGDLLAGRFVTITAVPEPSAVALVAAGGVLLGLMHRRRWWGRRMASRRR